MKKKRDAQMWHDCVQHAFGEAADNIVAWEYGGAESDEERFMTKKAADYVAKRIRAMALSHDLKFHKRTSSLP